MKIKRVKFKDVKKYLLILMLYKVVLDISFYTIIIPYYTYRGMDMNFSVFNFVVGEIVLVFCSYLICSLHMQKTMSSVTIEILFIINYIPSLCYFSYTEMNFFPLLTLFYVCLFIANKTLPNFKITYKLKIRPALISRILLMVSVLVVAYIWVRYANMRIHLNIFDVYKIRAEARKYAMPTLLTYAFTMIQILLPVWAVFYLSRKEKIECVIACLGEFLIFCINGTKSSLFSLVLILGVWFVYCFFKDLVWWVVIGCIGVSIMGVIEQILFKTHMIGKLLLNRIFFMPNLLNYFYYEFFAKNGIDYYRAGFLSHFGFESTYDNSLPRVIGMHYYGNFYGDEVTNANNGLFSDAYANLGVLGVIIIPFLTVFLLRLLDGCAKGINKGVQMAIAMLFTMKFIGDSMFTVLLSGGMFATYILLIALPRDSQETT